jgi:lipopolysaccharide biosynthesis glycosyltransferase
MNGPSSLAPVRILCAADAAFAAPLCVMLVSLLANFPSDRAIEIYVLTPDMPSQDRAKIERALRDIFPGFGADTLHWLSSSAEQLQGLQASGHVNVMTYSRLLAPFVLPEVCERVLYLDSDMVILSDVCAIYDLPDDGRAVHAVHDMAVGTVSSPFGVFN